ncbi:trissin receptor-like [Actinia tenebrosa]|uniref:Trissin receptor-like n=1 Tax=Actinia tenebrosa TaxID=6105 RepID=A0A6P8IAT6_ACTTE|nr:trissin receptor-like [Actinia tenebrosa]
MIAGVFVVPIFLFGIIGNLFVVIAVSKKRSLRSTTNYLLANLAISDVACLIFCAMAVFAEYIPLTSGTLADILCKFFLSYHVPTMASIVSILTLAILAVERYHAVVKPMKRWMRLKENTIKYAFCAIWLTGILFTLPMFINGYYRETSKICRQYLYWNRLGYLTYQVSIVSSVVFISFAVMVVCYFHIVRNLYFRKKNVNFGEHSAAERLRNQRKRHVVKLSLSVTLVFVVFLLPFAVLAIMKFFNERTYRSYYKIAAILFFTEAGINPFLYAFQSTNFRQAFKQILKCFKI